MSQFNKKSEHFRKESNSKITDNLHDRKEIKCGEYIATTYKQNAISTIFANFIAESGKNLSVDEMDKLVKFLNNYTQEELKFAAITSACKLVAKKRGLTLDQQMLMWIPLSWREE